MTPSPLTRWDPGSPVVPLDAIIGTEKEIDFQTLLPAPCIIHSHTQKNTSVPPHALRSEGERARPRWRCERGIPETLRQKSNNMKTRLSAVVLCSCVCVCVGALYIFSFVSLMRRPCFCADRTPGGDVQRRHQNQREFDLPSSVASHKAQTFVKGRSMFFFFLEQGFKRRKINKTLNQGAVVNVCCAHLPPPDPSPLPCLPSGGQSSRRQHFPQAPPLQRQAVRRGHVRVPRHRLQRRRGAAAPRPGPPARERARERPGLLQGGGGGAI